MPIALNSSSPPCGGNPLKQPVHADNAARDLRHARLMARMTAHRQGTGPAPAVAEFEQWKEDAAFMRVMRRLLAGLSVPG